MEQVLISIYNFFEKRRAIFYASFISCFLLLGYVAGHLRFEEDIAKILPRDPKIDKLNEVFQNSKFMDKIVVTISAADTMAAAQPDSLVAYAEVFTENLRQGLTPYIRKISDKVDDDMAMELYGDITAHLPVYLEEKDYRSIDTLISPERLKETLAQDYRTLSSPAGIALKRMISADPVGISFLGLKKLQQLQYDENFELYNNYVLTKDHKNLLLFITPAYPPNNTQKNVRLLEGMDHLIEQLSVKGYKNASAAYFGATAVSAGNAIQLRRDSLITQGITVLFLIVFLGIYFGKKRAPFIILVPVLFGALFSLAAIYFIKGSISVIALGTGSVVLGIAVNYSLHVFNHYRHTSNIRQVIIDLALPMTVGSFTTIGGFFCLEFVESEMLKDLGLFAAFSLIGASICSLVFLPHFIASKKEQASHTFHTIRTLSWIDQLAAYRPEYNKYLVILIIVATVFFGYWATQVGFESDLSRMNYMTARLKQSEKQLNRINQYALQSVYLVTEGENLQQALANNERLSDTIQLLEARGIVKKHSGVSSFVISDSLQKIRIGRWNHYWTADRKSALLNALHQEGAALKFSSSAFDQFSLLLNKTYEPADTQAQHKIRVNFLDDYITEKPGKATVVTLLKVLPENKPVIYETFDKFPQVTVLDKQYLANRFVKIINDDFGSIAIMTSLLVFVVLLIMYGRIELTMVSFIPMFISWVWILGIMGLLGIQFNIINIIVSALIFGLGDDYSLFIMDGLLQEYKTGKKNLSSFKSSILLSAITTIAGLGVLIFAKHPALQSIAIISMVGILCVVVMSQILIPFFFNLLIGNRVQKKLFPWTFTNFLKSAVAFSIFIGLSLLLALLGKTFAFLRVKERGKYMFHWMVSKCCWFLMYTMVNVKKKIINPLHEDLSKPSIIICNHQSSLDIVPLIMLHPKILMLTNNKKWNAPFFGPVIRMADYFPAEQMEADIEKIANRFHHGYSLIVFPEGTRSPDGTIGRFHKGAFYLAEKLKVDILPLMIHGTNYALTKKDTLLKDGQVTLKFLPRIQPGDTNFGAGYVERSKNIRRYFSQEFEKLRSEIEQPPYFREQLLYNYLYKGPVVEWYMRIKTRLEKNYQIFHKLIPEQGRILDIGCGYGMTAYMLSFAARQREITGIDFDEQKIALANHCFSRTASINFIHTDALNFDFKEYEAIIISDMLHYLQPAQQKLLLEKCLTHLGSGGVLLVRDGDKEISSKHKKTELSEFFSTRVFKFNKTPPGGLSFISGSTIRELATLHQLQCQEIVDSAITSNTIFVIKKNQLPV